MSKATLNRVTQVVVAKAKESRLPLESFTVHDLRRTGSTILNELGFNSDWIEKCLAHEDGRSSRGVYNKAEYAEQRLLNPMRQVHLRCESRPAPPRP
jgi:integrase